MFRMDGDSDDDMKPEDKTYKARCSRNEDRNDPETVETYSKSGTNPKSESTSECVIAYDNDCDDDMIVENKTYKEQGATSNKDKGDTEIMETDTKRRMRSSCSESMSVIRVEIESCEDDGDDDDDMNEDIACDMDEYNPLEEASTSRIKKVHNDQKTTSTKLKSGKKSKRSVLKVAKLKAVQKDICSKSVSQKNSTKLRKTRSWNRTAKTEENVQDKENNSIDFGLDADLERTTIEAELQETDDIVHYETIHKSLSSDEPFNPPSDVQETDGFCPGLGCFYCPDCGFTFQNQRLHQIHKWNGCCVYKCQVCSQIFTFRNISAYRAHVKTHKLKIEPREKKVKATVPLGMTIKLKKSTFQCNIDNCKKTFSCKANLCRHMKSHDKDAWHKCSRCSTFYSTGEQLLKHNELRHSKSAHVCDVCGRGFYTTTNLKRHKRNCHSETGKSYLCVNCPKSFTTLERLAEHMNFHLGVKPHACKHCQKAYTRYDTCKRHEKVCLKILAKKSQKMQFPSDMYDLDTFQCKMEDCYKKFSNKHNLLRHLKNHSENMQYKCTKCTRFFDSEKDLKDHNTQKHKKANLCDNCGKSLATSSGLKKHLELCQIRDVDKVPCSCCSKTFVNQKQLLEHMNQHLGYKPYSCKHCGQNFARYDSNKRHERFCLNGGILCRFCGRTFANKSSITDHIAANHENVVHQCLVCGDTFKYRASLYKHKVREGH